MPSGDRVHAIALSVAGAVASLAALTVYLHDPAYFDALASRLVRAMLGAQTDVAAEKGARTSSSAQEEEAHPDPNRVSDLGAIRSLLATTTLREFLAARHVGRPECAPARRDVLVLTPSQTVSEALGALAERSVISAPLLTDDRHEQLGFISVHDILSALITHIFPPGPCGYTGSKEAPEWFLLDHSPESARRILSATAEKGDTFSAKTLAEIRRGPMRGGGAWMPEAAASDATLLDVIQRYFVSSPNEPVNHRVALYRDAPAPSSGAGISRVMEVSDIFSVSDVTRFLSKWEHIKRCLTPCTVADLGVGTSSVDTVPSDSSVLRAFALMRRLGVSGLAVVEPRRGETAVERGSAEWPPVPEPVAMRFLGSISESDLRRIQPGHFDVLAMTVGEFIDKLHAPIGATPELAEEPMASARAHPLFAGNLADDGRLAGGRLSVTCAPDASVDDVLKALARNRVHRVYAVEPETKAAIRVITHSDLVRFFAAFAPPEEGEQEEARRGKKPVPFPGDAAA